MEHNNEKRIEEPETKKNDEGVLSACDAFAIRPSCLPVLLYQIPTSVQGASPADGEDDEDAEEEGAGGGAEDVMEDYLCAKLHLVSGAGARRAE